MAKEDIVAGLVKDIQDGVAQVYVDKVGAAYDQGLAAAPVAIPGTFTQADLDSAVAADKALLQPQIDLLTSQVSALQADDDAKTKIISGIQALLAPVAS